jgi:CRISPR-associated endonuclease/helicase Cas3
MSHTSAAHLRFRSIDFADAFSALTGNEPFPWQRSLYDDWFSAGKFPATCNLPTGLGKTSVIAVWLIALANNPTKVPRRLVYVVNRRTVVDQTTDEVEKYQKNLDAAGIAEPLVISTLRGQFADNREWSADPSRPAVICGTVDMIGSRLLFSGYGCGFKSKPLHAGFLGQDVLLVHDEAHLEPAFQELLIAIEKEQNRCAEFREFRVVELSATSRGNGQVFTLTPKDEGNEVIQKRIGAKKEITLYEFDDEKKLAERIAELALKHRDSERAILVFVRTVEAVEKVAEILRKSEQPVETLTGTLRGKERDELVEKPVFRRFLRNVEPDEKTVYLVCTSAGEVGVNISADHLVCDLSTFESMAQRFGRVNRFGECDDTRIDVVHPSEFNEKDKLDVRRSRTLVLLRSLNGDGSPKALGALDPAARLDAFSPAPVVLPTSDILFDAWSLTTVNGKLPARPPVGEYLHGVSEWEPPQTSVAWREEVGTLMTDQFTPEQIAELIDDYYPLKPHELLKDRADRVFKQIEKLANRGDSPVWVIERDESVRVTTLTELADSDKDELDGVTLLLPPQVGGLQNGLLNGDSETANDVADDWFVDPERQIRRRLRTWDNQESTSEMRLVRRIDFPASGDDEDAEGRYWAWYVRPASADDDGSKTATKRITWQHHTDDVTENAKRIVTALPLSDDVKRAIIVAAKLHDLGKKRIVWQRSIGNPNPTDWHAKSGKGWRPQEFTGYRHEFGSLLDVESDDEFKALAEKPDVQDLILHLIAAHHGRGRPHFPSDEAFDPEKPEPLADETAREVPRRFARLQRRFGRWGLAYLESLLRAADIAASINPSEVVP